jgi:hypothetical protein
MSPGSERLSILCIGIIQSLFSILNKHAGERFTLYWYQRKLTEVQVQEIQRLDPESELIDRLPHYFAQDLNVSMALDEAPSAWCCFSILMKPSGDPKSAIWRRICSLSATSGYAGYWERRNWADGRRRSARSG